VPIHFLGSALADAARPISADDPTERRSAYKIHSFNAAIDRMRVALLARRAPIHSVNGRIDKKNFLTGHGRQ
jgi:hypothetical protein